MLNVMLVADNPWVHSQVDSGLSDLEMTLDWVKDPRAVTDRILANPPHLALVDFQVGSMGGMALTRKIRETADHNQLGTIPVILLLDRQSDRFLAKRAGAVAGLIKPFTPQRIQAQVEAVLSQTNDLATVVSREHYPPPNPPEMADKLLSQH